MKYFLVLVLLSEGIISNAALSGIPNPDKSTFGSGKGLRFTVRTGE